LVWVKLFCHLAVQCSQSPFNDFTESDAVTYFPPFITFSFGFYDGMESVVGTLGHTGT